MSETTGDSPEDTEPKANLSSTPTVDEAEASEKSVKEDSSSNGRAEDANTTEAAQTQKDRSEGNYPTKRKRPVDASESPPPQKRSSMIKTAWAEEVLRTEQKPGKEVSRKLFVASENKLEVGSTAVSLHNEPATDASSPSLGLSTSKDLNTAVNVTTTPTSTSICSSAAIDSTPTIDITTESYKSDLLVPSVLLSDEGDDSQLSTFSSFAGFDSETETTPSDINAESLDYDINAESLDYEKLKSIPLTDNYSDAVSTLDRNLISQEEGLTSTLNPKTQDSKTDSLASNTSNSLEAVNVTTTTIALPSELLATVAFKSLTPEEYDTVTTTITPSSSTNSPALLTSNANASEESDNEPTVEEAQGAISNSQALLRSNANASEESDNEPTVEEAQGAISNSQALLRSNPKVSEKSDTEPLVVEAQGSISDSQALLTSNPKASEECDTEPTIAEVHGSKSVSPGPEENDTTTTKAINTPELTNIHPAEVKLIPAEESKTATVTQDSTSKKEIAITDPLAALVSDLMDTEDDTESDTTTSPCNKPNVCYISLPNSRTSQPSTREKLYMNPEIAKSPPLTSVCHRKSLPPHSKNATASSTVEISLSITSEMPTTIADVNTTKLPTKKIPTSNTSSAAAYKPGAVTSSLRSTPEPVTTKSSASGQESLVSEALGSIKSQTTLIKGKLDANKGVIMSLQYTQNSAPTKSVSEKRRTTKFLTDPDSVPTLSPSYLKTLSTYIKTAKDFTTLSNGKSSAPLVAEDVVKGLIKKVENMQDGATCDEYAQTDEIAIILLRKISEVRRGVKQKAEEITSLRAAMKLLTPTDIVAEKVKKITK